MILRRLSVEAFGALRGLVLETLGPGLTVVYGPNEAGKSTLLAAVRWLLFGQELRPPESGAAAVDALVEDDGGAVWHIARRVTPRARRGAVVVTQPDGAEREGQTALAEALLGGATWGLYRAAFALGLDELLEVAALDAPEVAGALFSAGAVGAADLRALERALAAEVESWWKPGGQRPAVNAAVRRLEEARRALAAARAQEALLGERLRGRMALVHRRAEQAAKAAERRAALAALERARRALPHLRLLEAAEAELGALGPRPALPEDLGERLAVCESALVRAEAAVAAVAAPPPGLSPARCLERAEAVRALVAETGARASDLARLRDARVRVTSAGVDAADAERALLASLGTEVASASRRWLDVDGATWSELERLGAEAERRARDASVADAAAPGGDATARPEDLSLAASALEADERLLAALRLDVAALADGKGPGGSAATARRPAARTLYALAAAVLAVVAGWLFGRALAVPAVLALALGLGAAAQALRLGRGGVADTDGELRAAVARASGRLGGPARPAQTDLEGMAEALARRRADLADAQARSRAAVAIARAQAAQADFAALCLRVGLPPTVLPAALPLVRVRLDAWRQALAHLEQAEATVGALEATLEGFARAVAAVAGDATVPAPDEALRRADQLGAALRRAELELEARAERERLDRLLAAAGAADGEEARRRLALARRCDEAMARRSAALGALTALEADAPTLAAARALEALGEDEVVARLAAVREQAEAAEAAAQAAASAIDRLEGELERLAEGSDVSVHLQAVATAEAEVAAQAAAWAQARLGQWLLQEARRRYEEERQPATLHRASAILARITDGRYTRVVRPLGGGELGAVRADGRRVDAAELSQGTRAQLYLALRLGLAEEYAGRVTALPLVLDDVLVAFDDRRRGEAVAALAEIGAGGRQLWLFTCHRAGLDEARAAGARIVALDPGRVGAAPALVDAPTADRAGGGGRGERGRARIASRR